MKQFEAESAWLLATRRADNARKTKAAADQLFPGEKWVAVEKMAFKYIELPDNVEGIMMAKSRMPINKSQEKDLLKEIVSARVLKNKGASVYLIPVIKNPDGSGFLPGPDAVVNGRLFEFKVVTGGLSKVEDRFRESRKQSENVFIRIENPKITKYDVIEQLFLAINNKNYTGGYQGDIVFSIEEKAYFFKISDFKQ